MIAYIKANPYHQISHNLFDADEYIYYGYDGYVYDENGYLFEDWDNATKWTGHNGIRLRDGKEWENGWYVKKEVKTCDYHFPLPRFGLCCKAYSESKPSSENKWRHWAHYPECKEENCPLKHPELLQGRTLETEDESK
jgi:hypothetical protein